MKKIITLCLFITFISCNTHDENEIKIPLSKTNEQNIAFNKMNSTFMAYSLEKKYPIFYDHLKSITKKDFKKDSTYISTFVFYISKFEYELYKKGLLDQRLKVDSLEEGKTYLKPLNFLIEYSKGNQIITFDKNYNNSYEDDNSIIYKNDFRLNNKKDVINNLKSYKVDFYKNINDRILTEKREIVFYPNSFSSYNGSLSNEEFINKSRIHIRFKDYWKGSLKINKDKYDIAVQGIYPYLTFLIKPDSLAFSDYNYDYNFNFEYKIKDTIQLNNRFYELDSVNKSITELKLKEVIPSKPIHNFRIGYNLKNYKFKSIQNNITDSIFNQNYLSKKYTLLEFWGTWCKPCVKLTPKVKDFFSKHKKELNILGVAYDKNLQIVKNYINNNDLLWRHTFIDVKYQKKSMADKLKVKKYPTFILVDNGSKMIIYRGVGKQALNEIENLIKDD